jgi:P27 family predicted phage terminase small subunit
MAMGILTSADTAMLVLLANTMGEYARAKADLERDGRYVTTEAGALKAHPAFHMMKAARADLIVLMRQFGMSPASRPALRTGAKQDAPQEDIGLFRL